MENARFTDLFFLTIFAAIAEFLGSFLVRNFHSGFYFSLASAIAFIAMIRWGWVGVLTFMASGLIHYFAQENGSFIFLVYSVFGNLFFCIPFIVLRKRNRNELVLNGYSFLLVISLCHGSLALGKGFLLFLLEGDTMGVFEVGKANFLVFVISCIVLFSLRHVDGLVCDMPIYYSEAIGEVNEKY